MNTSKVKSEFRNIIPALSFESHKGQAGRVGIVGGCTSYTGAPYFAAISALKTGCDLAHVFCTQDASPVIKSYSPELIVHPLMDNASSEIAELLSNLHSLVIGPGLGRNENIFNITHHIINLAKERKMPLIFDADALFYINNNINVVCGYRKAILTPNKVEFERLYKSVTNKSLDHDVTVNDVEEVATRLEHVTIVRKGPVDIISDGFNSAFCAEPGSPRRCGGQGDVLSGSMGTFNYWAHNTLNTLSCSATMISALCACMLTRKCSYLAFQKFKRSTITTNLIEEIPNAFSSVFNCD